MFVLLGVCFAIGYRWRLDAFSLLLAVIGGLELVQLIIPGRHARISDFVENAFGLGVGVCIASTLNWLLDRVAHRGRS
jgi:VanZ family protein